MKKIFAISVLSVMAVVGTTNAWANAPDNRNLATVSFVERSLGDFAYKDVIQSNMTVGGTNDYYSDDYVTTSAWVHKQDEKYAETIAASLDTKVDRAEVIKADGTTTLAGTTVDSTTLDKDTVAPTVANVEANFVPNKNVVPMEEAELLQEVAGAVQSGVTISPDGTEQVNTIVPSVGAVAGSFVPNVATTYKDDHYGVDGTEMRPGLYTIMVEVDENGNKRFIWQAVQESRYRTSVVGEVS